MVSIAAVAIARTMIHFGIQLEIGSPPDVAGEYARIASALARPLIKVHQAGMAMPFGIVVTRRSVAGAIVQPELGDGPPASAPNIPIISIDHEAHIVVIGAAFICPGSNGKKMD